MADGNGGLRGSFWVKALAPAVAAIVGLLALRLLTKGAINQASLSAWLSPLGTLAPLAFLVLLAVRPLTLLPGQLLTAVGGLLFGTLWGTVYSLVGSLLSSVMIFLLGHTFGKRLMRRAAGARYPAWERLARQHGFQFALLSCLNPLFPTDVAQAMAAAAGARFWPVALGALVGTVPGTFLTAQFGSAIGQGKPILTTLSAAGMVLSLVFGLLLGRRMVGDFRRFRAEEAGPGSGLPRRALG